MSHLTFHLFPVSGKHWVRGVTNMNSKLSDRIAAHQPVVMCLILSWSRYTCSQCYSFTSIGSLDTVSRQYFHLGLEGYCLWSRPRSWQDQDWDSEHQDREWDQDNNAQEQDSESAVLRDCLGMRWNLRGVPFTGETKALVHVACWCTCMLCYEMFK